MTVAATNSPAQRDAIRPAAVKRSLQPIRHAKRRAQAAAVVRDFTSARTKRSPSFDSVVDRARDGINNAVDAVTDGVSDAVDAVGDAFDQVGEEIGTIIDSGTGAVLDFVESVRIHRLLLLINTDML